MTEPMTAVRRAEIRNCIDRARAEVAQVPGKGWFAPGPGEKNSSAELINSGLDGEDELLAEIDRLRALWAAVAKTSQDRKAEADGRRLHNQRLEDELTTRTAQLELQRAATEALQAERDQALVDLETAKGWRDAAIVERDQLRREVRDYRRANTSLQEINTIRTAERDQLKAELERMRARVEELEPFEPQLREMNMSTGGWSMTIEQAKSASGAFVAAAKAMLDGHDAENYVEQEVFLGATTRERYMIIYVRPGKKGPHQLRREADAQVAGLLRDMATVARHIEDGEYSDADQAARQALGIAPGVDLPGR